MDEFTQAAIKKHAELTKELDAISDRKSRIENQIKGLVTYLQGVKAMPIPLLPAAAWPFPTGTRPEPVFTSKKDAITEYVRRLLKRQQPRTTRDLLDELSSKGITMTGIDPVAALSAVLSRDGRFTASRKDGWSLKEPLDASNIEGL